MPGPMPPTRLSRRRAMAVAAAWGTPRTATAAATSMWPLLPLWPLLSIAPARAGDAAHPQRQWYRRALEMRALAESWGDQSYGAVVVLGQQAIGLGPSRVVRDRDPDAHAERVAIREAQRALGRQALHGAVLYSTSRPCRLCETAAARAGIGRMFHGPDLTDAGAPMP